MNNLKQAVMDTIKTGNVSMHSRMHFVIRGTLLVAGFVLLLAISLFLVSFVVFLLRTNGLLGIAHFGMDGLPSLLFSLPWVILLLVVVVFITLELLASHFSFVYKRPLVYSILGGGVVVVCGGVLIAHSTIHEQMFRLNESRPIPGINYMYKQALFTPEGVLVGVISSSSTSFIDITARNGSSTRVIVLEKTRKPPVPFTTGDAVVVMTRNENGAITAIGIRPIEKNRALLHKKDIRPQKKELCESEGCR